MKSVHLLNRGAPSAAEFLIISSAVCFYFSHENFDRDNQQERTTITYRVMRSSFAGLCPGFEHPRLKELIGRGKVTMEKLLTVWEKGERFLIPNLA